MTQEFRSTKSNVTGMLDIGMLDTENRPEDIIEHAIKERVAEDRLAQQIKDST